MMSVLRRIDGRLAISAVIAALFGTVLPLAPAWSQAQPISPSMAHCVEYLVKSGVFYGDPNSVRWVRANAAWLCDGSTDEATPPQAVACFSTQLQSGQSAGDWRRAVIACRKQRGFEPSTADAIFADVQRQAAALESKPLTPPLPAEKSDGPRDRPPISVARTPPNGMMPPRPTPNGQVPLQPQATPTQVSQVSVVFVNAMSEPVDVYSVGDEGLQPVGTVRPTETMDQPSAPGKRWVFGIRRVAIGDYTATASPNQKYDLNRSQKPPCAVAGSGRPAAGCNASTWGPLPPPLQAVKVQTEDQARPSPPIEAAPVSLPQAEAAAVPLPQAPALLPPPAPLRAAPSQEVPR